jgi:hypothetical protein
LRRGEHQVATNYRGVAAVVLQLAHDLDSLHMRILHCSDWRGDLYPWHAPSAMRARPHHRSRPTQ